MSIHRQHGARSVDDRAIYRLREETMKRFGSVHLVCLNAGVAPASPMLETSLDVWNWARALAEIDLTDLDNFENGFPHESRSHPSDPLRSGLR
jgi:hypothetical protein